MPNLDSITCKPQPGRLPVDQDFSSALGLAYGSILIQAEQPGWALANGICLKAVDIVFSGLVCVDGVSQRSAEHATAPLFRLYGEALGPGPYLSSLDLTLSLYPKRRVLPEWSQIAIFVGDHGFVGGAIRTPKITRAIATALHEPGTPLLDQAEIDRRHRMLEVPVPPFAHLAATEGS